MTDLSLRLQDLIELKVVIELASKRGAFDATEMAAIGTLYNRLKATVDFLVQQLKEQNENNTLREQGDGSQDSVPPNTPV